MRKMNCGEHVILYSPLWMNNYRWVVCTYVLTAHFFILVIEMILKYVKYKGDYNMDNNKISVMDYLEDNSLLTASYIPFDEKMSIVSKIISG